MFAFPYAGITRIRFEGIISAYNDRHPLTCSLQIVGKVKVFYLLSKQISVFFLVRPRLAVAATGCKGAFIRAL